MAEEATEAPDPDILTLDQLEQKLATHFSRYEEVDHPTKKGGKIYICECGKQAKLLCVSYPVDGKFWGVETPYCPECDEKPSHLAESIAIEGNCYWNELEKIRKKLHN